MTATVETSNSLQTAFKAAMRNVASPVSVVTTHTEAGPHGATVSAFASLSLDPPMLLVSLDNRSTLLSLLKVGSSFGVNILSFHQDDLATRFASKGADKFAGIGWRLDHGVPVIEEVHAWVGLTVTQLVPGGDHTLVLGNVEFAAAHEWEPLTYWRGTFGTHRTE